MLEDRLAEVARQRRAEPRHFAVARRRTVQRVAVRADIGLRELFLCVGAVEQARLQRHPGHRDQADQRLYRRGRLARRGAGRSAGGGRLSSTDPQIAWFLSRFITDVRSVSLYPVLILFDHAPLGADTQGAAPAEAEGD